MLRGKRAQAAAEDGRFIEYLNTTRKLGVAMLSFLLIYTGSTYLRTPAYAFFYLYMGETAGRVLGQLVDMLFYALSFVMPVLIFRWITPRRARIPMPLAPNISRDVGLIVPAGVAIVFCTALANSALLELFGLSGGAAYPTPDPAIPPDQAVLWFMASAVVPAFCEEFLFRGLVLTQLLPFGKTVAVIGSALLFGLMHGNPAQMLYSTAAGLVLGVVAVESGSIWAGMLIHLFNNMLSVLGEVFWNRLQYPSGFYLQRLVELTVVAIGMICLAFWIVRRDRKDAKENSQALVAGAPLPRGAVRGFFTLPMTAFCAIAAAEMLLIVVVAVVALL